MNEVRTTFDDADARSRTAGEGSRPAGTAPAAGTLPADSSLPAGTRSLRPVLPWRRSARSDYALATVVVALLAVAAFVLGRQRASGASGPSGAESPRPAHAAQHVAPPAAGSSRSTPAQPAAVDAEARAGAAAPRATEPVPFVSVEVEPPDGQIWLDREVAGVGSVQLGAIDDGRLHELRFMAPEHETKTLVFRNTPPAGRVTLKRIGSQEPAISRAPDKAASRARRHTARSDAATRKRRDPPRGESVARRAGAETPPPNRSARVSALAARPAPGARPETHPAAPAAPARKAPRIQLIEVNMPRVEVLD